MLFFPMNGNQKKNKIVYTKVDIYLISREILTDLGIIETFKFYFNIDIGIKFVNKKHLSVLLANNLYYVKLKIYISKKYS